MVSDFADDALAMKRAQEIIVQVNNMEQTTGKGIRSVMDFIDSKIFTGAASDSKRAFNAFAQSTSAALRKSVSQVSPVLEKANAQYASERQLVTAVESILGKAKFKSTKELVDVAKKLENLFKQGEFTDDVIDRFFTRIGVDPASFRGGEAARQAGQKTISPNTVGSNPFEIIRNITAAIVPPKTVRDIAIYTGLAEDVVKEITTKLSPSARGALIRLLVGDQGQSPDNQPKD